MSDFYEVRVIPAHMSEQPQRTAAPLASYNDGPYEASLDSTGRVAAGKNADVQFQGSKEASTLPGWLGTGLNSGGLRPDSMDEIKDNTLFTVQGMQIPAKNLVFSGHLVKDEQTGKYRLPGQAEMAQEQPKESPIAEGFFGEVSRETHDAFGTIINRAGSEAVADAVTVKGINALTAGKPLPGDLASVLKMQPEQAQAAFNQIYQGMMEATAKHITKTFGVQGSEVLDYLSENVPEGKRQSWANRVRMGDKKAFTEMVETYNRGMTTRQNRVQPK